MMRYVLVIDTDTRTAWDIQYAVDGSRYFVHCAHEVEEAEALIATVLHAIVFVNTILIEGSERQQRFVDFVRAQSMRTRVVFLRPAASRCAEPHGETLPDALVPKSTRPTVLAQLVDQLAG